MCSSYEKVIEINLTMLFKYNFEREKKSTIEQEYIHFPITNKKFNILHVHVQLFKNIQTVHINLALTRMNNILIKLLHYILKSSKRREL